MNESLKNVLDIKTPGKSDAFKQLMFSVWKGSVQ